MASPLRVVVTGSRHWDDADTITHALCDLNARRVILGHGNARGADRTAAAIAHELGYAVVPYPVDPTLDGPWPAAGHARNARMLKAHRPHLVIAFRAPGKSNGTDGCVATARGLGIPVRVVVPYS